MGNGIAYVWCARHRCHLAVRDFPLSSSIARWAERRVCVWVASTANAGKTSPTLSGLFSLWSGDEPHNLRGGIKQCPHGVTPLTYLPAQQNVGVWPERRPMRCGQRASCTGAWAGNRGRPAGSTSLPGGCAAAAGRPVYHYQRWV